MGVPFTMQDARQTASAPWDASILALSGIFLPGQPPQFTNPTSSMSPSISEKTPLRPRMAAKSVLPGHMSSVCMQRIMPTFIIPPVSSARGERLRP